MTNYNKIHMKAHEKVFDKQLSDRCKKLHENVVRIGAYHGTHHKTTFKCLVCGKVFQSKPRNIVGSHARKHICPNQTPKQFRPNVKHRTKHTTKGVANYLKKSTNGKYLLVSKYSAKGITIEHHDTQCKYYQEHHKFFRFNTKYKYLMRSKIKCPIDREVHRSHSMILTNSQLQKRVSKINPTFLVKSKSRGKNKGVLIEHHSKKCIVYKLYGFYFNWWVTPASLLGHKSDCPADHMFKYGTTAYFHQRTLLTKIQLYKKYRGEFRICSKYKGYNAPAVFEHHNKSCIYYKQHHKYYRFICSLGELNEGGCPLDNSTYGEREMIYYLHRHGLHMSRSRHRLTKGADYIYGYICKNSYTPERQHFDIFFPNVRYDNYYTNGIEIEFNGIQHLKNKSYFTHSKNKIGRACEFGIRISRDMTKAFYCVNIHIKQMNINNITNCTGKKLRTLVDSYLDKHLLPILIKRGLIKNPYQQLSLF